MFLFQAFDVDVLGDWGGEEGRRGGGVVAGLRVRCSSSSGGGFFLASVGFLLEQIGCSD